MNFNKTKDTDDIKKSATSVCKNCSGHGSIPIRNGASGVWELIDCPECTARTATEIYAKNAEIKEEIYAETIAPVIEKIAEIIVSPKEEDGKTKMELLLDMPEQIEKLGEILTKGIIKYPTRMGWATRNIDQYIGAITRHLLKYRKGEKIDPETGLPHILHVAINCMFIDYLEDLKGDDCG